MEEKHGNGVTAHRQMMFVHVMCIVNKDGNRDLMDGKRLTNYVISLMIEWEILLSMNWLAMEFACYQEFRRNRKVLEATVVLGKPFCHTINH